MVPGRSKIRFLRVCSRVAGVGSPLWRHGRASGLPYAATSRGDKLGDFVCERRNCLCERELHLMEGGGKDCLPPGG